MSYFFLKNNISENNYRSIYVSHVNLISSKSVANIKVDTKIDYDRKNGRKGKRRRQTFINLNSVDLVLLPWRHEINSLKFEKWWFITLTAEQEKMFKRTSWVVWVTFAFTMYLGNFGNFCCNNAIIYNNNDCIVFFNMQLCCLGTHKIWIN